MDTKKTSTKLSDKLILDNLNEKQRRSHYILKNYPDLYKRINEIEIPNISFSEKIFIYIYGKSYCKICNNSTKFKGYVTGYSKYCSKKCTMSDPEVVKKRNERSLITNLEKWGVSNPSKSEKVKDKVKKTNIKKWGVNNYTKTEDYKEKIKRHNLEKFGKEWYLQTKDFREKSNLTIEKKWGGEHPTKSDSVKNKMKLTNIERWGNECFSRTDEFKIQMDNYFNSEKFIETINQQKKKREVKDFQFWENYSIDHKLINIENGILKMMCEKCNSNFEISKQLLYLRKKSNNKICTSCNPTNGKNISYLEKEVLDYIKSIYNGQILENFKIEKNEIDIFLPEKNIGFEFNGLWYHGELFKEKWYHKNKIDLFKEKGINIFTIWEDQWKYKSDIIRSMIHNKLGNSGKIGARKCEIKNVSSKDSNTFLENNHIQGSINSKIRIGLYYEGELVSLMTFGKLRNPLGSSDRLGQYEMLRFCNKLGISCIGGASKLLNRFIKDFSPTKIISYADKSHSIGSLYKNIGFKFVKETVPNYWWIKNGLRNYRYSFRKDILVKRGYDENLSESEIMRSLGYYKLWDCGNLKFEYDFIKN